MIASVLLVMIVELLNSAVEAAVDHTSTEHHALAKRAKDIGSAAVFFALFFAAKAIYPLTTPTMIGDFKACGGFLLIATGCRIAKMQDFPVADMIPAMVLVMPLSALWTNYIAPLL